MKVLIAEDDPKSSKLLKTLLSIYGDCDTVGNGFEAVEAFDKAHKKGEPYDLICLDIMMPEVDGHGALKAIRGKETAMGIEQLDEAKIFMVTALGTEYDIVTAFFSEGCTDYIVKPIERKLLIEKLKECKLIE